jgi:hypothetical protein
VESPSTWRERIARGFPGVLIALGVPLLHLVVALLWDRGILDLEPNGILVRTLQAMTYSEIALGPLGIFLAGRWAGLRGFVAWLGLILVSVPVVAILWFVGVAYLGGLAGEPF